MKVIVKAIAGSHLFGTNTENSDKDYKGVFIPSREQILLGSYQDTIRKSTGSDLTKNTKDDEDIELYSLRKFFTMIENGDTAAIELLFTSNDMIIEKDPIWDEIVSIRKSLVSKKINAMIGYARQQANKYGIKGSRMGELNNIIRDLKQIETDLNFSGAKLQHAWDKVEWIIPNYSHCHLITMNPTPETETSGIEILGKKFSQSTPFSVILKCLSDEYKKYGQRAREARHNNGVDFKALSHAVRVMFQGIELMNTGEITLPHSGNNLNVLMDIKTGTIKYKKVEPIIESTLDELEKAANQSSLPEKIDREYLDSLIIKYHLQTI